jgi:hypothetical protein
LHDGTLSAPNVLLKLEAGLRVFVAALDKGMTLEEYLAPVDGPEPAVDAEDAADAGDEEEEDGGDE